MKYFVVLVLFLASSAVSQTLKYPQAKKVDQVDTYFGTKVADPYRWLENVDSDDVHEWVTEENSVTEKYLSQIPYREKLRTRLEQLFNYPRMRAPQKVGKYYFFFKNSGLQNQSILYRQEGLHGSPEVFLDPNKLTVDGTQSLGFTTYSNDDKYLAYAVHKSGSDWEDVFVKDIATGAQLSDHLEWVRYSDASWYKDGFFYGRYEEPVAGQYTSKSDFQKIYYHKIGTPQTADALIYEDKDHPQRTFSIGVTQDEKYVLLYTNEGGKIGSLISWKRSDENNFRPLVTEFGHNIGVIDNIGDQFLMITDEDAPTNRAVLLDPTTPGADHYATIIPAKKETLDGLSFVGGKLIATYMKDAYNHVYVYDTKGKMETEINLPGIGTANGFDGKHNQTEVFYTFGGFTTPPTIYRYDIAANKSDVFHAAEVPFSISDFVTDQVFYISKDGTKVPMFIVHKRGMKLDGTNPTRLYAYGGFNISLTPYFSPALVAFLEQGGVFAEPNLRGGGEYGKDWHEAGMKLKKQNVFDDFIAAAEYLITNKYTSRDRLAIEGGSNGGLLVGAVMCQRPDLCKVAFPEVGVMDMLRYHKFTIGWGWASEYGTSDDSTQFNNLLRYSPLHNLKPAQYPATLVSTADHDDRVVPGHSFKFAARLQEVQQGSNPTLITIETKAGHGGGKPLTKVIHETADQLAFLFYNMGVAVQ
jgi:prolyl oligopeptidase